MGWNTRGEEKKEENKRKSKEAGLEGKERKEEWSNSALTSPPYLCGRLLDNHCTIQQSFKIAPPKICTVSPQWHERTVLFPIYQ